MTQNDNEKKFNDRAFLTTHNDRNILKRTQYLQEILEMNEDFQFYPVDSDLGLLGKLINFCPQKMAISLSRGNKRHSFARRASEFDNM